MASAASKTRLVLASASARRLSLLQQVRIEPDSLVAANIDETPLKAEAGRSLAKRLSKSKAEVALQRIDRAGEREGTYVLAADTVVSVGRRILPKAELLDEGAYCLRLLSGRAHRVHTGITLITPNGNKRHRLVETRVRFKKLSNDEFECYLASGEWRGKAGGYAIQGIAAAFVNRLIGSYSNVVGLPLHETCNLLQGEGYDIHEKWITAN